MFPSVVARLSCQTDSALPARPGFAVACVVPSAVILFAKLLAVLDANADERSDQDTCEDQGH